MKSSWLLSLLAGAAFVASAAAQSGTRLTDGDATFDYAFGGSLPGPSNGAAGNVATNFQLAAPGTPGMNWMPNANWFYRFQGDNRERQLTNSVGGAQNLTGTNEVEYVIPTMFSGGANAAQVPDAIGHMHFKLTDTGVNKARLETEFCIENTGSTTLTADVFFVANIDIFATALGDTFSSVISAPPYRWNGSEGLASAAMFGSGAIGAGSGNAGLIMGKMTNSLLDDFNPIVGPGGTLPGTDAYLALQFNEIVPPGQTICVGVTVEIDIAVPEPTMAATMLLFGALALARRRASG